MADFCKDCGSLIIKSSCTNRKCKHHVIGMEPVTYKQICYAEELLEKLHDNTKYAFRDMTIKDASKLIKGLESRIEVENE